MTIPGALAISWRVGAPSVAASVLVPVVRIWKMPVGVRQRLMAVAVGVRLFHRRFMRMLMVLVMNMAVLMFERRMAVFMRVPL